MDRQHRISELREIVRANPNDVENWLELGLALTQAGLYDEGILALTKAYELAPHNAEIGNWLAYSLNESGQFKESLSISTALVSQTQSATALYYMGWSLRELGEWEAALKAFEKGIQQEPESQNLFGAATVFIHQGRHAEAAEYLRKALQVDGGENPEILYLLAMSEIELGQREQAVQSLEQCLQAAPDHIAAANELGLLYTQVNRIPDALTLLNDTLKRDSEHIVTLNNLGYAYFLARLYKKSEFYLRKALDQDPDYSNALYGLGSVYAESGNYEAAVIELEKLVSVAPDFIPGWISLINSYVQNKDSREASATLKRALQRHPESEQLKGLSLEPDSQD